MAYGPYGPGGPQGGWGGRPPGPPPYPPGPGRHTFGGGYGPPPQWRPPRRKNHSALVWVLAGLGVFAFVGIGVILVSAVTGHSDDTGAPVAQSSYTPGASSPAYSPSGAPSDTHSAGSPNATPSPGRTANTGRAKNSVYQAGALPATRCPTHPENLHSSVAIRTHLHHLFACLDKAWAPELNREGIALSSPHSVLTAGSGHGACGDYPTPGSGVPYYCPTNNTIYASTTAVTQEYGHTPGYGAMALDSLFAHEYGHHVQNLTGIMDSYSTAAGSENPAKQLALSRRLELQATCFAGMFMNSARHSYPISSSQENELVLFNSNVGDWGGPRNHGTPAHNGMWYDLGWQRRQAAGCNTWTVSASQTS